MTLDVLSQSPEKSLSSRLLLWGGRRVAKTLKGNLKIHTHL